MKTNISIELSDAERSHIANLLDGKPSKRLAKREEIVALANSFFRALSETNIDEVDPGPGNRTDLVASAATIVDIDRGGWSFIGEPPGA